MNRQRLCLSCNSKGSIIEEDVRFGLKFDSVCSRGDNLVSEVKHVQTVLNTAG